MILLEVHSRVIEKCLNELLATFASSNGKLKSIDMATADFDGVLYHVSTQKTKATVQVSINVPFFENLAQCDVNEALAKTYGSYFIKEPEAGYSVTLSIDIAELSTRSGADQQLVVRNVSRLKRNCFGAVFEQMFAKQKEAAAADKPLDQTATISYRSGEKMYIRAWPDRVTVIFSTTFKDPDDAVIWKVFLQEFKEGRRSNQRAPQLILAYRQPPLELANLCDEKEDENRSFITFVLLASHMEDKNSEKTIDLLLNLRDYLHYHIKCSKAYIHSRIRQKTDEFIRVLNQSKCIGNVMPAKQLKTISGKTFVPPPMRAEIKRPAE